MILRSTVAALATLLSLSSTAAFYLPGSAPRDYLEGEKIDVFVNTLTPMLNSKLKSLISYDYYDSRFHFCSPEGGPERQPESLGSILFGDRILSSPYEIRMLENSTCQKLCQASVPKEDAAFINERIREDYGLNLLIDGLPSSEMRRDSKTGETFLDAQGFNLGDDELNPDKPALNNHYDIYIQYHMRDEDHFRVVGVLVYPSTVNSMVAGSTEPDCFNNQPFYLSEETGNEFFYTYSVSFLESNIPWGLRWDAYLHVFDPRIHWFSLINSLIIAGFLVFMVGMVLLRSISRDIHRYNAVDLSDEVQEDYGWKLVHGEVFRLPQRPMLLSVMVGNGIHLIMMCIVTLVFALFGFLSPSNRGSLATVLLICWTFFGCVSGYASARTYTTLGGEQWKTNLILTAVLFPTVVFTIIGMLNFFLIFASASGAVPFGTILAVLLLWFLISAPLSVAGYFYGMKHGAFINPVRVASIPRQIPPKPWYLSTWPAAILGGILPFGAAFVELYFVLSSLFGNRAYYAFGFLFLTFIIVALTTATVTVLFVYFLLCAEEYRWHWRAFLIGGGSAFWLFAYGVWYWASRLYLNGFTSVVLYFGYLFLVSLLDFLVGGSIGYVATYFMLRRLYTSIRVD
ncbi:endosomal P24A protein [Cryptococcus deuterogattii 99/473]|uniref:Transmembrane 9 superfamily member n=2 Tax=Cryptococcus deuterogattii TaxID=1859096 RepID=A0A0D0V3U1_9TREE|nr:endosomal P24A protein [Cryptococcus deuterogattii R265]KIR29553.1 endosomal P24A protein [Cryptococcus deuterogattii LA55]KIR34483.1 endosomal P24A protein [Cryptococcus deuterogattii MMRL2647]KIR39580.1 endosomal P24A protein [Cryptococcus deuterogattii Ram5]KIR73916.1 endosomal P24A protein [Cryptococcus deuterogattii CA1014]KIR93407.1 endosomal P24A protein [Cryptococcus deuterogattii CBS 10090]KIY59210.1 endosomal P24A protein [Cryptococcus deuterogattii 99/473]